MSSMRYENSWPLAKSCLKMPKQQAMGSRRASMIVACGSMSSMSPTWQKLLGILSMKRDLPER
jgi:hypothetical protein